MISAPWVMRVWEELSTCVRTGESVFERVHGSDFWEYLATHPEDGAGFGAAMGEGVRTRAAALVAACDLSPVGTLVDVGGGQGQQLATVLAAVPSLQGILFDRPEVVAAAGPILEAAGIADRCAVVGGDFFAALPPGGDAYALTTIIHDWPDEEALRILRVCYEAVVPDGRVWLIEEVVQPDRPESAALALLDLNMLLCFGARERTADEYRALLEAAGFADVVVHPTDSPYSVIEGWRR